MVDHRVHIAGTDCKEKSRLTESAPGIAVVPIRLRHNTDAEACRFEYSSQNGHRKAWVIDVGVSGDEHDIDFVPASFSWLRPYSWEAIDSSRDLWVSGHRGAFVVRLLAGRTA